MLGVGLKALKNLSAVPGAGWAIMAVTVVTFLSILLHEFGHVFAARGVGGDSDEIILWPLGGLAQCDLPPTPRAHLLTALAGPFVNLGLCVLTAAFLAGQLIAPPVNLITTDPFFPPLENWSTGERATAWYMLLAGRIFWVNWFLFLLNLLPAFPLDGGRALHAVLWSRGDESAAAGSTAYVGFGVMLVMCVVSIFADSVLLFGLALIVYMSCRALIIRAETGVEEPGGFDGPADEPPPPRKPKPGWLQRWRQERAARLARQEQQDRENEERRLDEILAKVQERGRQALTPDEERFLSRVSARYRNNRS
jgi:Zn-dependent protease